MTRLATTLITLAILVGIVFGVSDFGVSSFNTAQISDRRSVNVSPVVLKNKEVTLIFVGDIMLSRSVGARIAKNNDPLFPFRFSRDFLHRGDITFGNLESVISDTGRNVGSAYSFRADPFVLDGLVDAGFDVVSIANNHAFDWGRSAFSDSMSRLMQAGIRPVGGGASYDEANTVVVLERSGIRFGWYAYTNLLPKTLNAKEAIPGLSEFDEQKITQRIQTDKKEKNLDYTIVSMHWGNEYATEANTMQKKIAHELVDAGADIVIGHHPHVVQEVEWYKGKYIAYSLGNFVFDQYFSPDTMQGLVVHLTCDENGIMRAEHFSSVLNASYQVERLDPTIPIFIP